MRTKSKPSGDASKVREEIAALVDQLNGVVKSLNLVTQLLDRLIENVSADAA